MDQEGTKATEATPSQAGEFLAELFKGLEGRFDRQNKFEVSYANNFQFEPSTWDLKLIMGQLEQHTGESKVDWHTAVTIPWLQVKLVAYFLRLQAAWYEAQNGPIMIPSHVLPKLPPLSEEEAKDPAKVAWYTVATRIYAETIGQEI